VLPAGTSPSVTPTVGALDGRLWRKTVPIIATKKNNNYSQPKHGKMKRDKHMLQERKIESHLSKVSP